MIANKIMKEEVKEEEAEAVAAEVPAVAAELETAELEFDPFSFSFDPIDFGELTPEANEESEQLQAPMPTPSAGDTVDKELEAAIGDNVALAKELGADKHVGSSSVDIPDAFAAAIDNADAFAAADDTVDKELEAAVSDNVTVAKPPVAGKHVDSSSVDSLHAFAAADDDTVASPLGAPNSPVEVPIELPETKKFFTGVKTDMSEMTGVKSEAA